MRQAVGRVARFALHRALETKLVVADLALFAALVAEPITTLDALAANCVVVCAAAPRTCAAMRL